MSCLSTEISTEIEANNEYQYEDNDIICILGLKLNELKKNGLQLDVHQLAPISDHALEQFISDVKNFINQKKQFIQQLDTKTYLVIPYNLGIYHWTGLLIILDTNFEAKKVIYCDSLNGSAFIPDALLKRLIQLWPNLSASAIETRTFYLQSDNTSCGVLAIENLIKLLQMAGGQQIFNNSKKLSIEETQKIRKEHLELIKLKVSHDKYESFYRYQRDNRPTVLSLHDQLAFHTKGVKFSPQEYLRIHKLCKIFKEFSSPRVKEVLLNSLRYDVNQNIEVKIYLDKIRSELEALWQMDLISEDSERLFQFIKILIRIDVDESKLKLELIDKDFRLSHEELKKCYDLLSNNPDMITMENLIKNIHLIETQIINESYCLFPEVFEAMASRHKDNTAIIDEYSNKNGKTKITYEELSNRVNQLANYLKIQVQENYNKWKNDLIVNGNEASSLKEDEIPVGVFLPASAEAVIAILAIWKAGLVYVPLGVRNDRFGRTVRAITQTKPKLIISNQTYIDVFKTSLTEYTKKDESSKDKSSAAKLNTELLFDINDISKSKSHKIERVLLSCNNETDRTAAPAENSDKFLNPNENVENSLQKLTPQFIVNKDKNPSLGTVVHRTRAAYIFPSSGSTGNPKDIIIEHRGLYYPMHSISHMRYKNGAMDLTMTKNDVVGQFAELTFDASILEIMMTLGMGASLVIVPEEIRTNANKLSNFFNTHKINICTFTPTMLTNLEPSDFPKFKFIISTGEKLPKPVLDKWTKAGIPIVNGYGPSEVSIATSLGLCTTDDIHIGQPIANLQIHVLGKKYDSNNIDRIQDKDILDDNDKQILVEKKLINNEEGELYIQSPGLARGYLNNPDLTNKRFMWLALDGPGKPLVRVYRTRDAGKYNNGNYYTTGRLDRQIKIYGQLLNPEDIDEIINKDIENIEVAHTFVEFNKDNSGQEHPIITAYILLKPGSKLQNQIADKQRTILGTNTKIEMFAELKRCFIKARKRLSNPLCGLPYYQIPSRWSIISDIALNPNQKIETSKLNERAITKPALLHADGDPIILKDNILADSIEVKLANKNEIKLANKWREILNLDEKELIYPEDNFLWLGGTSIHYLQLQRWIETEYPGIYLPSFLAFYEKGTFQQMAMWIHLHTTKIELITPLKKSQPNTIKENKFPLILIHALWGNAKKDYSAFEAPPHQGRDIYLISAPGLENPHLICRDINTLAGCYARAIRAKFGDSGYVIAGWSTGGAIANAVTNILHKDGHLVAGIMLDTLLPKSQSLKDQCIAITEHFKDTAEKLEWNKDPAINLNEDAKFKAAFEINNSPLKLIDELFKLLQAKRASVLVDKKALEIKTVHSLMIALHRYKPVKSGGLVCLLKTEDRCLQFGKDSDLGWKAVNQIPSLLPGAHHGIKNDNSKKWFEILLETTTALEAEVSLRDIQSKLKKAYLSRDENHQYDDERLVDNGKVISIKELFSKPAKSQRIWLSSARGMGKSTLAREITKKWASDELMQFYLVIYIVITKELADDKLGQEVALEHIILKYLLQPTSVAESIKEMELLSKYFDKLPKEKILIIIDNYESINDKKYTHLNGLLSNVINTSYLRYNILILSQNKQENRNFQTLALARLTKELSTKIVREKNINETEKLLEEISKPDFGKLIGNPLYLHNICTAWLKIRNPQVLLNTALSSQIKDDDHLKQYLSKLIRVNESIAIRGTEDGETMSLPLEKIYVALTIDTTPISERECFRKSQDEELRNRWQMRSLFPQNLHVKLEIAHKKLKEERQRELPITCEYLNYLIEYAKFSEQETLEAFEAIDKILIPLNEELMRKLNKNDKKIQHLTFHLVYEKFQHLVILGQPGSGKSTLAKWLTLKMAKAMLEDENLAPEIFAYEVDPKINHQDNSRLQLGKLARLPVLIQIWQYSQYRNVQDASHRSIKSFILNIHGNETGYMILSYLEQGLALITMDGLDEISKREDRDLIIQDVHTFLDEYGIHSRTLRNNASNLSSFNVDQGNRLIVTSRIAGNYASTLRIEFTRVIIEEMEITAVEQYFYIWMQTVYEQDKNRTQQTIFSNEIPDYKSVIKESQKQAHELTNLIKLNPDLYKLVKTPQLAAMVAYVYHFNKGKLPDTRSALYETAINHFTLSWRARLNNNKPSLLKRLSLDDIFNFLEILAYQSHSQTAAISEQQIHDSVRKILKQTKDSAEIQIILKELTLIIRKDVGLLTTYDNNEYRFLHRTFQEYLAGRYLVKNHSKHLAEKLAEKIDYINWREPILMALAYFSINHPNKTIKLTENLLKINNNGTQVLPRIALLLVDALPEMKINKWLAPNKQAFINMLLDYLLASYKILYQADFKPLIIHLQQSLLKMIAGNFRNDIESYLIKALQDPQKVTIAARVITDIKWPNLQFLQPLLQNIAQDNSELGWSIQEGLRLQILQNHSSINKNGKNIFEYKGFKIPSRLLPFKIHMENKQESILFFKESPEWFCLIVALYNGYDNLNVAKAIKEYNEMVAYLQLNDNVRASFEISYHDEWGREDPIYQIAVYLDTEGGVHFKHYKDVPSFNIQNIYQENEFTSQIIKAIDKKLKLNDFIKSFPQSCNTSFLAASILGISIEELLKDLADLQKMSLQKYTTQLMHTHQDASCRLTEYIEKDFLDFVTVYSGNSQIIIHAALQILMIQGSLSWGHINIIKTFPKKIQAYMLAEIIAKSFTTACDDIVYNSAVQADAVNSEKLSIELLLEAANLLSLTAQWGKPVEFHYWPIEMLPLPALDKGDISSAVFSMIANVPQNISLWRELLLGQNVIKYINQSTTTQQNLPEALIIALSDNGDHSDRNSHTNQILSDFIIDRNWAKRVLSKILQLQSPYHQVRAISRLWYYLPNEKIAHFRWAYNLIDKIDDNAKRVHALEILINEYPLIFADENNTEITQNELLERVLTIIDKIKDHDIKALFLARFVFQVNYDSRLALLQKALHAISQIADEEKRAYICLLLKPLWGIYATELKSELHQLINKFKNPFYQAYVQGKTSLALREFFITCMKQSFEAGMRWAPVFISGIASDIQIALGTSDSIEFLWKNLKLKNDIESINVLLKKIEQQNLIFSMQAALVLDELIKLDKFDYIKVLFQFLEKPQLETLPILMRWLNDPNPHIHQMAALLICELKQKLLLPLISKVINLLKSPYDLLRFRAANLIHHPDICPKKPTRWFSVLGKDVYEELIKQAVKHRKHDPQISVQIRWMGNDLIMDDITALEFWIDKINQSNDIEDKVFYRTAIKFFEYCTKEVWEFLLKKILHVNYEVQVILLMKIAQLIYYNKEKERYSISEEQWQDFIGISKVFNKQKLALWPMLHVSEHEFFDLLMPVLKHSLNHEKSVVYKNVTEVINTKGTTNFEEILNLPDDKIQLKMKGIYKNINTTERSRFENLVAKVIISKNSPELLKPLIFTLYESLHKSVQDEEMYSFNHNLLMITAAIVSHIPLVYAYLLNPDRQGNIVNELHDFTDLLIKASRKLNSFPGRRAALILLGHVDYVHPKINKVIKHSMQDVDSVRQGVIEMCIRLSSININNFKEFSLIENLNHESVLISYSTAKLLTSIATAEECSYNMRQIIFQELSVAVNHPLSKRYVYFGHAPCKLPDIPRLDAVLVKCLMQIANLPLYDYQYRQNIKSLKRIPFHMVSDNAIYNKFLSDALKIDKDLWNDTPGEIIKIAMLIDEGKFDVASSYLQDLSSSKNNTLKSLLSNIIRAGVNNNEKDMAKYYLANVFSEIIPLNKKLIDVKFKNKNAPKPLYLLSNIFVYSSDKLYLWQSTEHKQNVWKYYFILPHFLDEPKEFMETNKLKSHLERYGFVIKSGLGESPPLEVIKELEEKFSKKDRNSYLTSMLDEYRDNLAKVIANWSQDVREYINIFTSTEESETSWRFYENIANWHYKHNNLIDAVDNYQKAILLGNNDPQIEVNHHNLGWLYQIQQNLELSEIHYKKSLDFKKDSSTYCAYGILLFYQSRFYEAILNFIYAADNKHRINYLTYTTLGKEILDKVLQVGIDLQGKISISSVILAHYYLVRCYNKTNDVFERDTVLKLLIDLIQSDPSPLHYRLLSSLYLELNDSLASNHYQAVAKNIEDPFELKNLVQLIKTSRNNETHIRYNEKIDEIKSLIMHAKSSIVKTSIAIVFADRDKANRLQKLLHDVGSNEIDISDLNEIDENIDKNEYKITLTKEKFVKLLGKDILKLYQLSVMKNVVVSHIKLPIFEAKKFQSSSINMSSQQILKSLSMVSSSVSSNNLSNDRLKQSNSQVLRTAFVSNTSHERFSNEVIIPTSGDGNCAFNAVALGVCDLLEVECLSEHIYKRLAVELKLSEMNKRGILFWLKRQDTEDRQKIIATILRKWAISYIEENYYLFYAKVYEELLYNAYTDYCGTRAADEMFCVHSFILDQFKIKCDFTKDALIHWWNLGGKNQYFNNLKQSARDSTDRERWGSDVEISALATYLDVNIRWKKELLNDGEQLGIGSGLIDGIDENQYKLLINLGIGGKYHGRFRLNYFADRSCLEARLNSLLQSSVILDLLGKTSDQNNYFPVDISGIDNYDELHQELIMRNVVIRNNDGTYRFYTNEGKIDREEIIKRLKGLQDEALRNEILKGYKTNVPEFGVLHQGQHWSYLRRASLNNQMNSTISNAKRTKVNKQLSDHMVKSDQLIDSKSSNKEETKTRNGLKNESKINSILSAQINSSFCLGKAIDNGDCFFDALAQLLNRINNTDINSDKYLRMLCHDFYLKNKELVDQWNKSDYGGIDKGRHDYFFIQYTAEECVRDFNDRSPIWGRPYIEGRILCCQLKLEAICVIEILEDPETKLLVSSYHLVNKESYKSISENDAQQWLDKANIPCLVVEQNSLHFVPLYSNGSMVFNTSLTQLTERSPNVIYTPDSPATTPLALSVTQFGLFPLSSSESVSEYNLKQHESPERDSTLAHDELLSSDDTIPCRLRSTNN